jgi:hypothetical protein
MNQLLFTCPPGLDAFQFTRLRPNLFRFDVMLMIVIRILIIILLVCAPSLRADPIEMTHTLIEGNAASSVVGTYPFRVEVRQVTADKAVHKPNHRYGHYDNQHEYVCSRVSISLNGKSIRVPDAAYSDLCYLQAVEPPELQEDGRWMVLIEGGSGGESYEVQLIFDASKLLERRVAFMVPEKKTVEVRKF